MLPQLGLRQAVAVELDDLCSEHVSAEARVRVGVLAAQLVIHVQRRHAVPETGERMLQTGRVGASGDETAHLAARLDQLVRADVLFDPFSQRDGIHTADCAREPQRRSIVGSQPRPARSGWAAASRSCTPFASMYAVRIGTPAFPPCVFA